MFAIAFLIGLYANIILVLGMLNLYYQPVLAVFTFGYIFLSIVFWPLFDEKIRFNSLSEELREGFKVHKIWMLLIVTSFGLMLIGALAPEIAFDSLWYHLTLPKIFLTEHGIRFFPGGLLHYSATPKLAELLYVPALSLQSEILAKLIHMAFGVLTSIVIYLLARKYTDNRFALISVVIFLGNIVVLWEATTAFIDLTRAFFEIMAFWGLLEFINTHKRKWLVESSLLVGLAIQTKLIGITTLVVYVLLLFLFSKKDIVINRLRLCAGYILLALLVPLPWFIFSYIHTGNPVYPLFSQYLVGLNSVTFQFPQLITDLLSIFVASPDPVSPIYLILFPLFFMVRKNLKGDERIIFLGVGLSLIVWTLTPKTGGGRFLLPYLPLLSVATALFLYKIQDKKTFLKLSLLAVITISVVSIFYRGAATVRYLNVVLGIQSKEEFLTKNLNFTFGDYYDTDAQFTKFIKPSSTVLLYGFHNLYYMDVSFIDSTWVRRGDRFEYIATQHTTLPSRFKYWTPIYSNSVTGVTLYTANQPWIY